MKELDEIDLLFQETFEEFELTPDPSVKENIDRAIASKKKRRRFFFILSFLFFATASSTMLYFLSFSENERSGTFKHAEVTKTHSSSVSRDTKTASVPSDRNENGTGSHSETVYQTGSFPEKNTTISYEKLFKRENPENGRKNVILRHDPKTGLKSQSSDGTVKELPQTLAYSAQTETKDQLSETGIADSTIAKKDSIQGSEPVKAAIDQPITEIKKTPGKWSIAIVTGWESEKKRPSEPFDTSNFSGPREFAQIHGTSFYGKAELNRKIGSRLDLMAGLGFRSTKIRQYGTLYSLDSFAMVESVTSTPNDSMIYFVRQRTGTRTFQVHSVTMSIGLAYSIPVSQPFGFRLSGGTELAYCWSTDKQTQSYFSDPEFRQFGLNLWLRPEIQYTFGRYQLFGFGSFNQAVYQPLKWDFVTRRNPSFGAGIGLLIKL